MEQQKKKPLKLNYVLNDLKEALDEIQLTVLGIITQINRIQV